MSGLIVSFNGPPQSGKNAIAKAVRSRLDSLSNAPTHEIALASPLRHAACILIGAPEAIHNNEFYEELKGRRVLGELTLRDLMIKLSEDVIKLHGERNHWAMVAWQSGIRNWLQANSIVFVTDLGFSEEQIFFEEHVERANLTVHVHREGCSFVHDSRNYQYSAGNVCVIHNNSSLDAAATQVLNSIAVFYGNEFFNPDDLVNNI